MRSWIVMVACVVAVSARADGGVTEAPVEKRVMPATAPATLPMSYSTAMVWGTTRPTYLKGDSLLSDHGRYLSATRRSPYVGLDSSLFDLHTGRYESFMPPPKPNPWTRPHMFKFYVVAGIIALACLEKLGRKVGG